MSPVPPGYENDSATALQRHRPQNFQKSKILQLLLKRLSQSTAFEAPRYQRKAPPDLGGSSGPSRISDAVRPAGHVAWGNYPHTITVCLDLPAKQSFRSKAAAISEGRN